MDTKNYKRITPAMPFLSLDFVCDEKKSTFQSEAFSKIDGKKLIAELREGKGDYFDLCRKVNLYTSSVISGSCADSFPSDVSELAALRDECSKSSLVLSDKINGWLFDFCLLKGTVKEAFTICKKECITLPFQRDCIVGNVIELSQKKNTQVLSEDILQALCLFYSHDQSSELYQKNLEIYSTAFCAVIPKVIKKIYLDNGKDFIYPQKKYFRKRAFTGLMCSSLSGVIKGEYIPFSENTALMEILGAVSRYTDNVIRQGIGIKTKLPGVSPDSELRRLVTDTVREILPGFLPTPAKVGRKPKKRPASLENKEATKTNPVPVISLDIDFDKAKKLCTESWRLASLMGGDYGENDISLDFDLPTQEKEFGKIVEAGNVKDNVEDTVTAKENYGNSLPERPESTVLSEFSGEIPKDFLELFSSLTNDEIKILECIVKGGDIDGLSRFLGGMALGFADSINEKASDKFGDIIIDTSRSSPKILEDYRDELYDILIKE